MLSRQIKETRERLDYLNEGRFDETEDEYSKELHAIRLSTEEKSRRVDQYMKELSSLNVIPIAAAEGYVDFPAIRENEEVYLCWCQGEEEVIHWHPADQPCSSRRPADLALIRQSGEMPISNSV